MSTIKKIAQNSGSIIIANLLDTSCSFLVAVFLVRYFGQAGFGKLSFLAVFLFLAGSLDNQWIRPILIREISRHPDKAGVIAGSGLIMKTCVAVLVIFIFWAAVWFSRPSVEIIQLAFFASGGLLITSLVSSYLTMLQVELRMANFVFYNLLSKILLLLVVFAVIFFRMNLVHFYALSLIPLVVLLLQVRQCSERIIKPSLKIDFGLWRKIIRESWPLALTALFIFIYHRLDQLMLFYINGEDAMGTYSASVKLAESFSIIPVAVMTSVSPLLSRYFQQDKNAFEELYRQSFKYLLMFIVPAAFGISMYAGKILSFFYGGDLFSSGPVLSILILAEIFVFAGVVNNSILVAAGRQGIDPLFTGVSAAINLILNLILIPKYGILGAAAASFLAYSAGPVMGYFIKATRAYSRSMLVYSLRPVLASLLMAGFILWVKPTVLVSFLVSPCLYILALYLLKGFSHKDIQMAKSAFSS